MVIRINNEKLKKARKKAGMTQPELAKKFGVTVGSIVNWERGLINPNEYVRPLVIKFMKEWGEG